MEKLKVVSAIALLSLMFILALPISGVRAQETLIFSADVSSNGTPVISPLLQAGRQYRIVAYGVFWSAAPPFWYHADAQFYTTDGWVTYAKPGGIHSFLQIDGADVDWGMWSNIPYYHTYEIYRIGAGAPITLSIMDWIDGNYANNQCHFRVLIYEGPPVPPEGETAYAYGGSYATCFRSLGFSNWGWTNGPLAPGGYIFDIYAGAGLCDLTKGTLVGHLAINYTGSTAYILYTMDAGWAMQNTHLYVGSAMLPMKDGVPTVAPGQYPYQHTGIDATSDLYTVTGLSGDIYVIAHADVFEV